LAGGANHRTMFNNGPSPGGATNQAWFVAPPGLGPLSVIISGGSITG